MIKVGQVYKCSVTDTIMVVTSIGYHTVSTIDTYGEFEKWIYKNLTEICNNGIWELIAEYPSWQEAVNSKEFNDTVNDTVNDIVKKKERLEEKEEKRACKEVIKNSIKNVKNELDKLAK